MSLTIPPYIPPVTGAGTLNGQREISRQVKTIAAAGTTIPIVYGEAQIGGRIFAATFTGGFWYVGAVFCVGEIDSFTSLYLNGVDVKPATPAGMTITYYVGTTAQTADATLASAISGYTDTLVVTNGGGSVGLAYVVLKYNESHYSGFPTIMAKIKGRKIHNVSANLIANSEDISSAGWALGNADSGSSLNATAAPDGTTTADKLTEATVTANQHFVSTPTVTTDTNAVFTFSVFLKSSERTFGRIQLLCKDGTTAAATINLTTGLIESSSGANLISAAAVNFGLSWFRVSVTANVGTGGTAVRGRVFTMLDATTQSYAGTIGSGIFVWGAQLEQKRSAGVYTKTTGTASTAAWSDNPALCARDLILNPVFGLGEDVDDVTVKCARQECDALVTTEKRRTLNLVIDSARSATDWINTLATYSGCWIYKSGGRWTFKPDRPAFLWQFTSTTHSYTVANGTLASGATAATFTQTAADQILYSPAFFSGPEALNICGRLARYVRARVRRTSGAGAVDTTLFYRTNFHGESISYYKATTAWTAANGSWAIREWDMHSPTAGGDEWKESVIGGIRIDFTNSAATDVWEIDWISVGVEPITTAGVVAGSFTAGTADASQIPTIIRIDYTDTSTTEYKARQAYAEIAGVPTGAVPRRESVVLMPGVTRYSQAYREAAERLAKLQNSLYLEFTRFDEGIATEIGDVLSVMHPYVDTASAVECDDATLFLVTDTKTISPGRVRVRATKYDILDYDNSESTTTWGAYTRRAGNLGGSGDGINRIQPRFAGGWEIIDYDGQFPVAKGANNNLCAVTAGSAPDPTAGYYGAYAMKIGTAASGTDRTVWFGSSSTNYTMPLDPNSKWLFSCKFWPRAANTSVGFTLKSSAGTSYTLTDTTNTAQAWNDFVHTASGSNLLNLVNDASGFATFGLNVAATSTYVWFDGLMLEKQAGEGAIVSPWRPPIASSLNPNRITPRLVGPGTLDESVAIDDGNGNARSIVAGVLSGTVTDGLAVTFTPAFQKVPLVTFNPTGLTYNSAYSAASHALVVEARSLSASGFTAFAKVRQLAATITARTDTTPTDLGSGQLPRYTIQKSQVAEAWDDRYVFNFSATVRNIAAFEPGWNGYMPGQLVVGVYIATADSGSPNFTPTWTLVGTLSVGGVGGTGLTTTRSGLSLAVTRDGLGQRGGTCPEFGIGIYSELVTGGSVTFTSVTYETATTPTDTSATAAGVSPIPYTVIPQ